MLELKNINFSVKDDAGVEKAIINDFNLKIPKGEFVTLFGRSGCGKTTLLNIISGLTSPTKGVVIIDGEDLKDRAAKISFVFQENALFPFLTVQENVEFGMKLKGIDKRNRNKHSEEVLKNVGLLDHKDKYPNKHKLSGGMKQRIEIAGVLADENEIILMDEPFSALDDFTRESMQKFLLDVWGTYNKTIVFVTHNKDEAILLSDRIIVLSPEENRMHKTISVDLPRPRNAIGVDFLEYKKRLTEELNNG